jgi:hypothetical protein
VVDDHVAGLGDFEADLDDELALAVAGPGDDGERDVALAFEDVDDVGQGVADLVFGDLVAVGSRKDDQLRRLDDRITSAALLGKVSCLTRRGGRTIRDRSSDPGRRPAPDWHFVARVVERLQWF